MSDQQTTLDFEKLMNRVKEQRCRDSFRTIFKFFFGSVLAYLKKSGIEGHKSTDLAQDAFLKVWHKSDLFDASKGSFKVWLFTLVRNLKFDYLRSKKIDILSLSSDDIYDMSDTIADHSKNETIVLAQNIKDRLSYLPVEQRDAVESIYLKGYSQSEYADEKGLPLGTVKSRIRLAFAQLKKEMEDK